MVKTKCRRLTTSGYQSKTIQIYKNSQLHAWDVHTFLQNTDA